MQLRFWGTRGSLATPGPATLKFGGNTSCVELRADDGTLVVLDCGTGAFPLGQALLRQGSAGSYGSLLISHTHWDHIQGFPFFAPLYVPGNEWHVYGPGGLGIQLQEALAGQQEYRYFPVTLDALGASMHFHDLAEGQFNAGGVQVRTCYLNHPAVTLGYRLTRGSATVVYATDHEPHWSNPSDPSGESVSVHSEDLRHVSFLAGADLVIHDAQYRLSDFPTKSGWGHTPAERAVDYCVAAGVKQLALFHHDPMRSDEQLERLVDRCRLRAAPSRLHVFAAAEGMELRLSEGRTSPSAAPELLPAAANNDGLEATFRDLVLVVDDDPDALEMMRETLETDGFAVVVAGDGDSALRIARDTPPDLILLDWMLPGSDGPEVCRRLRLDGGLALQRTPIVMITGLAGGEHVARGFEAGASDYLAKPFTPAYLRSRVRDWLLRRGDRLRQVMEDVQVQSVMKDSSGP